jgi:predicted DsbA family dithiol-disulfide isomerase
LRGAPVLAEPAGAGQIGAPLMPAVSVLLFADFACPYSYVTEAGLRRMVEAGEVRLTYAAYELYPAPAPLPRTVDGGWMDAVRPLAQALELPLSVPPAHVRTRKAHELAAFAEATGVGDAVRDALYAAYFVRGLDLGRVDVLVEVAVAAGLDESEAKAVLDVDVFTAGIASQNAAARRAGVTGVPTLAIGEGAEGRVLVGARPYATLRDEILNG